MTTMDEHSTRIHLTGCPLDCPDTCTMAVEVTDGAISRVEGTEHNPLTDGLVCGKVRNVARHVYGTHRVPHPLIRTGPKGSDGFRRASWDEALGLVASRLNEIRQRDGGEAILPCSYGGSNGAITEGAVDERLWRRLGASRLSRDICAQPTTRAGEGMHGRMVGVALQDHVHAGLIVVWGTNPASSGIHYVPIVKEARRRGARLVVIDPRRVGLATQADLHLPVRPGTDLPVALALANWLFENGHADESFLRDHTRNADALRHKAARWSLEDAATVARVEAEELLTLARWFAESSPAVIRMGWGMERNRNGGSAAAAIFALPAVGGKFGVRGGGFTMSNSSAVELHREDVIQAPPTEARTLSLKRLGAALMEQTAPRVSGLFVYNCNILATAPAQERVREGMSRDDLFTVVMDSVMTDTARLADVVLPATTFLEHHDLRPSYGAMAAVDVRPVIPPVGESRSNTEVFAELIQRCGLQQQGDLTSPEELRRGLAGDESNDETLRERGILLPTNQRPIQFVDTFPRTADRRLDLHPRALDQEAGGLYQFKPDPDEDRLALITPSTPERITSTFGQLHRELVPLQLNPTDMADRGLTDGDRVRVSNDLAEMLCTVVARDELPPGVACHPKGLWSFNTEWGVTNNALCPDTSADLGGGACYNDARVSVARI